MKTVAEILKISVDFLNHRGIAHPRRQVEELLSHVLQIPRIELYMQFDRPLVETELENIRGYLKKRTQRMPWQYIVGQVQFLGCRLEVSKDVLIPRPETEILVDMVLKELPTIPVVIWDVCCGSGCIGIALKKKRPDCQVVMSDISHSALEVAERNAKKNEVQVVLREGDLLSPFVQEKADIVVCNPPYVSEEEYGCLEPEVREWEPKVALVGGQEGTEMYQKLARQLLSHMHPQGKVYLEIGREQGSKIKTLFEGAGWSSIQVLKDWSSHDRFIKLENQDLFV